MGRINLTLLASFRHQLWLERMEVKEEFATDTHVVFALEEPYVSYWAMDNLRRIAPFSVTILYVDGDKTLCLTILKDS